MYWGRGSMQGHSDRQGDIRTKGACNYVQERVWESEAEAAASLLHSLVSLKKCRWGNGFCQRWQALNARLVSWWSWPWENLNGVSSLAEGLEVSQEAEPEQRVPKGLLVGRPSVARVGTKWLARDKMWIQPPQKILAWRVIHQSWEPNGAEHLSRSQCRADDGNKGQEAFSRCHDAAWAPAAWKTPRERRGEPKLQNWF